MNPTLLAGIIIFGIFLAVVGVALFLVQRDQLRTKVRTRLGGELSHPKEQSVYRAGRVQPLIRRYRWAPVLVGIAGAFVFFLFVFANVLFAVVVGVIVYLLTAQLEAIYYERRVMKAEVQLADAIDLIVSALNAGSSVPRAIDYAADESREPMGELLEDINSRIQLGDDPQDVFRDLTARVPLENFRLFAMTLAVHWEVGGSLGPTLASVGTALRNRIETARRIHSMTAQSRISIIFILIFTYFIAYVMWRWDPESFEGMLSTDLGLLAVAAAMLLQAVGIAWSHALSKPNF